MINSNLTVAEATQWFIIGFAVVAIADIWLKKGAAQSSPAVGYH